VGCNLGRRRWQAVVVGDPQTDGRRPPKQFCSLGGSQTLLEQTRRRISRTISEEQTLILLTRTHERFYSPQLGAVPKSRLLVQPYNHGTAPAIACSLALLERIDRDAVVAFFPSDHYFQNDDVFGDYMEAAFAQAHSDRNRVVLLGIVPDAPEESYGWIQPGELLETKNRSVFEVSRFWEKPSRKTACCLMRSGCLWNSFVMVGYVSTFLELIRRSLPSFSSILLTKWSNITPGREDAVLGRSVCLNSAYQFFQSNTCQESPRTIGASSKRSRMDGSGRTSTSA
jgi:mannose-1-phosphate guanylyltransferase